MKFTPKLPHTVPESLKIVKPDPGPLVKARTHERKAEQIRDERKKHEAVPEDSKSRARTRCAWSGWCRL